MKAICVPEVGRFLYSEVAVPVPAARELLVRVTVTGVCRTDLKIIEQGHRDLRLPRIPGEEIVGEVVGSGDPKDRGWLGQRVYVYPGTWCGTCDCCRRDAFNMCRDMRIAGFHRDGGFAEFVSVPRQTVIALPDGLEDDVAVFAEPLSCCINALEMARVTAGERLCIFGAGPAGTLLARLAAVRGAAVSVVDPDPVRASRHRHGVPFEGVYDVAIPAVGSADAYREAFRCLAPRGRLVAFSGLPTGASPTIDLNGLHYQEQTVVGAYGCHYRHGEEAIRLLARREIRTDDLVTHRYGLDQLADALDVVRCRRGLKVLLYPGQSPARSFR